MIELGELNGVNMNILKAAWKTNQEVRYGLVFVEDINDA